jgi:hypothetical protein
VPRGNGTLCKVIGVKFKHNPQSYNWKNYYGRKVWTINTNDVKWVECEHINKSGTIVQLEAQISIDKYPGFTTQDKQNRYTTSSIRSSKL